MLSGVAYDAFKPDEWGAALNAQIRKGAVGLSIVTTRFTDATTKMGDTVRVVTPAGVTALAYTSYSGVAFSQPTPTSVTVSVDQANYVAYDVDDIDMIQAGRDLLNAHVQDAGYALTDKQDTFVFLSYAASGSGIYSDHQHPIKGSAVNLFSALVGMAEYFDTQNAPLRGRFVVLDPVRGSNLRANPEFSSGLLPAERGFAFPMTGYIGHAAGLAVYVSNNLTTLSGVTKVLGGVRGSIAFAGPTTFAMVDRREARFANCFKALSIYGQKVVTDAALATIHIRN